VCPVNRRAAGDGAPAAEDDVRADVDLIAMLEAGDEELLAEYGRWYVPRRDPRYLRRNALVALGNTARREDARAVATLDRYAEGADELLAEHARWARDQVLA
jgi:epoxyqueuosine reductase QueG